MESIKQLLAKTIPDPDKLTICDWIVLSDVIGFNKMWAYNCWIDKTSLDLSQLSLLDWEEIASQLEVSESWAYYRYKEFSKI